MKHLTCPKAGQSAAHYCTTVLCCLYKLYNTQYEMVVIYDNKEPHSSTRPRPHLLNSLATGRHSRYWLYFCAHCHTASSLVCLLVARYSPLHCIAQHVRQR